MHIPPPGLHSNTSPDLSPISATSSLLTPTDSPARASCLKIDIPYDHHPSIPSPQGLQLQTGAYRAQDMVSTQPSRFPPPHLTYPYQSQEGVAIYEPFSERSSILSTFPPPIPNSMHVADRRIPHDLPWFSDRVQPPSDWLRPDDCARDRCSGLVAEEPSVPQKAVSNSPQSSQGILQGNEVQCPVSAFHSKYPLLTGGPADQLPLALAPFLITTISPLCLTHYQILRPTSLHISSTETQDRRFWRARQDHRRYMRQGI